MKLSRVAYWLALAAHVGLLVGILVRGGGSPLSLLVALPLLLPLPGIVRGRVYTASWACMLVVFYVGLYLAQGYATPATKWGAFTVAALGALDFVGLVLFVRLSARERLAGVR